MMPAPHDDQLPVSAHDKQLPEADDSTASPSRWKWADPTSRIGAFLYALCAGLTLRLLIELFTRIDIY